MNIYIQKYKTPIVPTYLLYVTTLNKTFTLPIGIQLDTDKYEDLSTENLETVGM